MRRVVLSTAVTALFLAPVIASAKLPYFGLDVVPIRSHVGEPIMLTMTCYEDESHTRPWGSCLGTGGTMAWVHPLDDEGKLDRDDRIEVEGRATSSGRTRGRITLDEPGAYDVLPLWRTWGRDAGDGFPGVIRIEVTDDEQITPVAFTAFGVVGICLAVATWKRRRLIRVIR